MYLIMVGGMLVFSSLFISLCRCTVSKACDQGGHYLIIPHFKVFQVFKSLFSRFEKPYFQGFADMNIIIP